MHISILGSGWLGLPLGQGLAHEGHEVHASTTSPQKLEAIAAAGLKPHLVGVPTEPGHEVRASPAGFWDADLSIVAIPPPRGVPDRVAASRAQLEAVARAVRARGVPWVVYCSSTGVYSGDLMTAPEDAAGPLGGALREGGAAVWAAEQALRDADAADVAVLRLAGLYGPGRPPGRFLAGKANLPGGDRPVNLVHRDDVIAAVLRLVALAPADPSIRTETLNLCADEHPVRRDFYPEQARTLGLEPPTFADGQDRSGPVVQNERAKARLGLRFRPLGQG